MLTVFLQNGEGNPAMQRRAGQITDMLLEKTVPESQRMSANEMVKPEQPQGPAEAQMGNQMTMNS